MVIEGAAKKGTRCQPTRSRFTSRAANRPPRVNFMSTSDVESGSETEHRLTMRKESTGRPERRRDAGSTASTKSVECRVHGNRRRRRMVADRFPKRGGKAMLNPLQVAMVATASVGRSVSWLATRRAASSLLRVVGSIAAPVTASLLSACASFSPEAPPPPTLTCHSALQCVVKVEVTCAQSPAPLASII
jgi:hypothetical protein